MTFAEYKKKRGVAVNGVAASMDSTSSTMTFDEYKKRKAQSQKNSFVMDYESYLKDYKDFANTAASEQKNVSYGNAATLHESRIQTAQNLRGRANLLSVYLDENRNQMTDDAYEQALSMLEASRKDVDGIMDFFGSKTKYYSQWDTEEDYNAFVAEQEEHENMLSFDLEAGAKEIEEMEAQMDTLDWTSNRDRQQMEEISNLIKQKQQYMDEAKKAQEFESRSNDYTSLMEAEDFAEKSKYVSTANGQEKFNACSGTYSNTGFNDIDYDYINRNEDARSRQGLSDIQSNASFLGVDQSYLAEMDDDEIAIFNYLYATQGKDAAYEYTAFLTSELSKRQRLAREKDWAKYADDHPIASSAFSVATSPLKGLSYIGQAADLAADGTIDQNAAYNKFSYTNSAIRNQVSQKIEDSGKWGKVGSFLYQTGMSMGDFVMSTAVSGGNQGFALAIMGTGAAADATIAAKDRGLSDGQAFALGTVAGAAEILMEKVSLDTLFNADLLADGALKYVLKNALAEGSEEIGTDLINTLADVLVAQDKSQWQAAIDAYVADGKTEGEAFGLALADKSLELGLSGLGGMLSGGVLSGVGAVINAAQNNAQTQQLYGESQQELVTEALEINPDNTFAKKMQAKLDGGKNLSGSQMNKLVQQNEATMNKQGALIAKTPQNGAETVTEVAQTVEAGTSSVNGKNAPEGVYAAFGKNKAEPTPAGESPETGSLATPISSASVNSIFENAENVNSDGYTASEDGKTYLKSTGDTVNVMGVASIKDGKMTLKLEDGRIVDAKNVEYGSAEEAVVYESVANMGVNALAANMLIENYTPGGDVSATVYVKGIEEAYMAGTLNIPQAELATMPFASDLAEYQQKAAYQLGELFGGRRTAKEQATIRKNRTVGGADTSKGKVHFEGDRSSLNATQKASMDAMDILAKSLGVQIYVFESEVGADGKRKGANGWYDPNDGSIHIDLYAGVDGKGTMLFTVAHELTHFIRQWSPAKFKVLANFLMKQYGEQGVSVRELVQNQIGKAKRGGREISYDTAYEEVVADSMETMLADGSIIEMMAELKQQDKTLWAKIRDWFKDLAGKLQAVVDAYKGVKPDSVEGRLVADMQDVMGTLEALYMDALVDASENFDGGAQKITTEDSGGVKYSFNNSVSGMANDSLIPYSEELTGLIEGNGDIIVDSANKLKEIVDIAFDEPSKQFTAYFGILSSDALTAIEKDVPNIPTNLNSKLFKAGRQYSVAATMDSIRHLIDEKSAMTRQDVLDYLDRIADTITERDSVHFDYYTDSRNNKLKGLRFKKSFSDGTLVSFHIISNKKMSLNVQTVFMDGASYQKKKSAKPPLMQNAPAHTPKVRGSQTSNISIGEKSFGVKEKFSQRDSLGNTLSSEQQEYFRDSAARDNDGNLLVLYHQTDGDFTIFNTRHPGAGSRDSGTPFGIFMKRSAGDIGLAGKKQMALYANITNPLRATNREDLTRKLCEISERYASISDQHKKLDAEYREKFEQAKKAWVSYITEWRAANPGAGRNALNTDPKFNELFDAEDNVVDEWTAAADRLSIQAKEVITEDLRKAGYDGVFLAEDVGSWGRKTDAIIALDPEQVKNITNKKPTKNPDIRYSDRDGSAGAQKNTADGDTQDSKYSITEGMSEEERYAELKNKKIVVRNDEVSADYSEEIDSLAALNDRAKSKAERIIVPLAKKLGILGKTMTAKDVEIDFIFSKNNGLMESISKQLRYGGNYVDFAKTLMNLDKVIDSAVLIEVHGDKYAGTVRANENLQAVYVLFGAFRDGKSIIPVQMEIKKSSDVGGRLYLTVALTKIEADVLGRAPDESQTRSLISASEYSLADLFSKINPADKHFLKYIPDGFLNEEQIKAKMAAIKEDEARIAGFEKKFSDRDPDYQKVNKVLKQENAKLKEDVSYLKELVKIQRQVTNGTKFTKTSVEAGAKAVMKSANAKGDFKELSGLLNSLYEYIASGKDLTWEGVREQAQPAVEWLQEHVDLKPKRSEYAQDILNQLHGSRVYLDESQMAEVAYRFGSYNDFRKQLMGSITFSKDADTSLDTLWQQMADLYPDVFDSEVTSTDMPEALADIIHRLRTSDTTALEYARNRELIAQDLLQQVYDSYWRVSTLYTVADVKQQEINRLKGEHYQRMAKLREYHVEKTAQLKQEHKARLEKVRQDYRDRADAKIEKITQKYQESRQKGIEGRRKTEMRRKIQKVVNKLNDLLLKPTKERHVPIGLQKAVAEILDAINMETTSEEGRKEQYEATLRRYDRQIAFENDPEKIRKLREKRRAYEEKGDQFKGKMDALKKAYDDLKDSEDPLMSGAYSDGLSAHLMTLIANVGDTPLRDMSVYQLECVYNVCQIVLTTVRNANKNFNQALKQSTTDTAKAVISEIRANSGENVKKSQDKDIVNKFSWENTKPIYAIERIKSPTLRILFKALFDGSYKYGADMKEAADFRQSVSDKYGFKSWDMDQSYEFSSNTGKKFRLTLNQIMTIYAYSKRDAAHDHMTKGGIQFPKGAVEIVNEKGRKETYILDDKTAYGLSDAIIGEITSKLTAEQKAFADEMQAYLSDTMGAKGNEVSLALYGIKLFGEKHYFPLRVSSDYLERAKTAEEMKKHGQVSIVNSGFTHSVKPDANKPIIVDGFMEMWADHVTEMSTYHAMALPVEDFRRVYNYNDGHAEDTDSRAVSVAIGNAYGSAATEYIDQLYKDLNGGVVIDPRETSSKKRISNFKKAATMLSMSVVVQQPSSIGRALALIDARHFFGEKIGDAKKKELVEEIEKYAPIIHLKQMGGFDASVGGGAKGYLLAEHYSRKEWKSALKDKQFRDDAMGWMPAKADEMTWCMIWNAAKRETKALNPGMDINSEAFLQKAGERFTEVIEKTQVYDSVLSRSSYMRSRSGLVQMMTSFMAEPTTTINMVEDAIRSKDKRKIGRTMGAVAASIMLNNLLVSFVYAMRDDDENETFLEKYGEAFISGIVEDLNPLSYYPFLRDINSLFQGYDVERSDMSALNDLADAVKKAITLVAKDTEYMSDEDLAEHCKGIGSALASIFNAGCSAFGVPAKNIIRDVAGLYNGATTIYKDFSEAGRDATWNSFLDKAKNAALDALPAFNWLQNDTRADKVYRAIMAGDTVYENRLLASSKTDSQRFITTYTGLANNDPRIKTAAVAHRNGEFQKYRDIINEIVSEGKFSEREAVGAINLIIGKLKKQKGEQSTASGVSEKPVYDAADYYKAITLENEAEIQEVYDYLHEQMIAEGYIKGEAEDAIKAGFRTQCQNSYMAGEIDRDKAVELVAEYGGKGETEVKKWDFELEYGFAWGSRVRAYRLGKISEDNLIEAVMDIEGEDLKSAEEYIRFLDLEMAQQDFDIDANDAGAYFSYAEPTGIDIGVYLEYKDTVSGIESDKDKNGKTISGSKKKKVLEAIDALDLSDDQKDALYFASGYKKSTLDEAPWHQ